MGDFVLLREGENWCLFFVLYEKSQVLRQYSIIMGCKDLSSSPLLCQNVLAV